MKESAERFLDAISKADPPWRSIDIRTVAVKIGGRWTQLATRAYLDHRRPRDVDKLHPVIRQGLMAWQFVKPVGDTTAVVNGFVDGCISVRPRSVWILDGRERSRHELLYYFNDLAQSRRVAQYDFWSGHSLVGYGPQVWDLAQQAGIDPQELDNIIRAGPNPYDGYAGLTRFFHGRPEPLSTHASSSVFEIIAPLAVRFRPEGTVAATEQVSLGLRARARAYTRTAEVHWTSVGTGPSPQHGSARLRDLKWKTRRGELVSTVQVPLSNAALLVSAFLQDHGRCIDRVTIPARHAHTNRRLVAHSTFDEGLERFHRGLLPSNWSRSSEFEQAVGILLHFFGFQLDPLSSQVGAGAALDHVAHDPFSEAVLGVECTVGAIETAKLGKLIARTSALRSVLGSSEVVPLLICARPRDELARSELTRAEGDGVVVLGREDLEGLWISLERGATSADLLGDLRARLADVSRRAALKSHDVAV